MLLRMQITTLAGLISTQKKKQKTSKQKRQTNKKTNAVLSMESQHMRQMAVNSYLLADTML